MALCASPIAIVLAGSSWTQSPWLFRLVSRSSQLYTRMLHGLTILISWGSMFLPECSAVAFCQRFKAVHRWPAVCRFNLFTTKCERPLTLEESDFLLSPFRFQSGFSVWFCENIFGKQQTETPHRLLSRSCGFWGICLIGFKILISAAVNALFLSGMPELPAASTDTVYQKHCDIQKQERSNYFIKSTVGAHVRRHHGHDRIRRATISEYS